MIERDEPLSRTLNFLIDAVLIDAWPGSRRDAGCAVLLFQDDRLLPGASRNIAGDELRELCRAGLSLREAGTVVTSGGSFALRPVRSAAGAFLGLLAFSFTSATPDPAVIDEAAETMRPLVSLALEHKRLALESARLEEHDPLTNAGNPESFQRRLESALASRSAAIGVFCISIDRFALLDRILGRADVECLLCQVAGQLAQGLDSGEHLARIAGDEFLLLVPRVANAADAMERGERIRRALDCSIPVHDHELRISASIGVVAARAGPEPVRVEQQVRSALDAAKARGGNCVVLFDPSTVAPSPEHVELIRDLGLAIARDQLSVHYQPQIRLDGRTLEGVEALLRWQHPILGGISPACFIPLAEESGIVERLAHWLMERCFQDYRAWMARGIPPIRLALNISPVQFAHADFVKLTNDAIGEFGMDPGKLELEISENALARDITWAESQMRKLRTKGVSFVIDDFGGSAASKGWSPEWMRSIPVQAVKADREVMRQTGRIERIIAVSRLAGIRTMVKGLETRDETAAAEECGFDEGQGFFFAKPMHGDDFLKWALGSGRMNALEDPLYRRDPLGHHPRGADAGRRAVQPCGTCRETGG